MYKREFYKFLLSNAYSEIEYDPFYVQLRTLLKDNLPADKFLNAEELLHAEILFKLEHGFKEGYHCGGMKKKIVNGLFRKFHVW